MSFRQCCVIEKSGRFLLRRSGKDAAHRSATDVEAKVEAIQRRAIEPFSQFVRRRVRMRTPACGLSMMLVVARQRCNEGGTPSRLMVKHSSSPRAGWPQPKDTLVPATRPNCGCAPCPPWLPSSRPHASSS